MLTTSRLLRDDAGFLQQDYLDAIYKDLPGAVLDPSLAQYNVSCDAVVNVSFVFK